MDDGLTAAHWIVDDGLTAANRYGKGQVELDGG